MLYVDQNEENYIHDEIKYKKKGKIIESGMSGRFIKTEK